MTFWRCTSLWLGVLLPGEAGWSTAAGAQLSVTRGLLPAVRDSSQGSRFWAEFQHAPRAGRTAVAWNYKIGADFRLLRLGRAMELGVQLGHEMVATPTNAIGFDPRGAVWTEQLTVSGHSHRGWRWEGGAFMRCRHDIDTASQLDSGVPASQRVVILPGLQAAITSPDFVVRGAGGVRARVQGIAEVFGGATDNRTPVNRRAPRWSQARAAGTLTGRVARDGPGQSEFYVRAWHALVLFREPEAVVRVNHRVEAGVRFPGAGRGADLLLAIERQFDDMLLPAPRAARAVYLGIRLASPGIH